MNNYLKSSIMSLFLRPRRRRVPGFSVKHAFQAPSGAAYPASASGGAGRSRREASRSETYRRGATYLSDSRSDARRRQARFRVA